MALAEVHYKKLKGADLFEIVKLANFKTGQELEDKYGERIAGRYSICLPRMRMLDSDTDLLGDMLIEGDVLIMKQNPDSSSKAGQPVWVVIHEGMVVDAFDLTEIINVMKKSGETLLEAIKWNKDNPEEEEIKVIKI